MAEKITLEGSLSEANLASSLDEEVLQKIGDEVVEGFETDQDSRSDWLDRVEEDIKLATQVFENKTYPWPGAANVKFPLLSTAALQFAARAYPALVPGPELVTGLVKRLDVDGSLKAKAERIGRHMSYQLMCEMPEWEEDMDKLCFILPIVGCAFKKTYFDPLENRNVSELVTAENLVINYWAKSLEKAQRKTHIIQMDRNLVEERIRAGIFSDVELHEPVPFSPFGKIVQETSGTREPSEDETTPYTLLEQHTWLDLDEDGYKEPWIVTVEYTSKKVLRIVPRFDEDGIARNGEEIVRIRPVEYFTKFPFIPNPDGGIYDIGFGLLLGGINESINTLTNQLLDSGSLSTLQAGFIGRGIRIKGGNLRFNPGEWKQADFTGEDIAKNIFPLPTKEPSDVLFKLLEALFQSGKELASVAEIMVGKMPGQNTPATTTQLSVEQSLKIFTAIYKRVYRALGKEYEKLFRLNKNYLDERVYFLLNSDPTSQQTGEEIGKADYQDDILVKPNADPNVVSEAQELARAQGLLELLQLGTVNVQEATIRILKAQKQPNIAAIMQPNPPQPNPEQIKAEAKQQELMMKSQMAQEKNQMDMQLKAFELQMKEQEGRMDLMMKQMEMQLEEQKQMLEMKHAQMDHSMKVQQSQEQMQINQQQNAQKMELNQASHEQNMKMAKEKGAMNASGDKQRAVGSVEKRPSNKSGNAGNRKK